MTGRDRASNLVWYAREVLREMRENSNRGVWNGVVRRAQEALEMSLKAIIVHLGADYPREHDVVPALLRIMQQRAVPFDAARMEELRRVSAILATQRAPALYAEIICTQQDAAAAEAGAEDAFRLAVEMVGAPPDSPFQPSAGN